MLKVLHIESSTTVVKSTIGSEFQRFIEVLALFFIIMCIILLYLLLKLV